MGIESDKVVYEYLSRVGDVAQQRQLPSAERMRLVSQLRDEIDRRRAKAVVDSPAAVRRIIGRIGSPDDVVSAADEGGGGGGGGGGVEAEVSVPVQPVPEPEPRREEPSASVVAPRQPDWWRVDAGALGGDGVPGFVGGVEIPELLKPPGPEKPAVEEPPEQVEEAVPAVKRRVRLPSLGGWSSPLLLGAAALLVVGAVLGNLVALAFGWVIVYLSRRLSRTEMRVAVMGLPAMALVCGAVWLWGRSEGRWGEPVAEGAMSGAVGETWPWVVRGAAVASAVFLVWRARRRG
ncbi:MAG: hypothetical protein H5T76_24480 [Streptomyces sp.]|nr:hypothetical protein [Streptomyces sp.]